MIAKSFVPGSINQPYGLPKTMRINSHGKDYFYYRENSEFGQIPLPHPATCTPDEFVAAWKEAKTTTMHAKTHRMSAQFIGIRLSIALKQYLSFKKQGLTANSFKQYQGLSERFLAGIGDKAIGSISRQDVETFINTIKAKQSANKLLEFIKRVFKWLKRHKMIAVDHVSDIERFELITDGFARWTEEEVAQFKQYYPPGTWEHNVIDVLLNTGCRISDALALGPRNLDGHHLHYVAQKNKVAVHLTLPESFYNRLTHVTKRKRRFICHPKTNRAFRDYDQFYHYFKKALKRAGINKTCHGLRKTVATRLANAGFSASVIMAKMGWKRLSSAEIYVTEANRKKLGSSDPYDFDAEQD